ncbi:MAG: hypothetical protein HOY78_39605 [Saccharothrix sp.]|nr:hypothetical protein [Saccharothrix sp.]
MDARDFKRVRFSALLGDDLEGAVEHRVDPAVFPAVARRLLLRAVVVTLIGVALVAMVAAKLFSDIAAQEALLGGGVRVEGEVIWADTREMEVVYPVGDRPTSAVVEISSGRRYLATQGVVVDYDPQRPERMRTTSEPNVDWDRSGPLAVLLVGALFALTRGVPWTLRWARRLADRSPRWRHGRAVLGAAGGGPFGVVTLDVRYDDGGTERLCLTRPVRGALTSSRDRITGTTEVWITERGPRTALLGLGPLAAGVRPFDGSRRAISRGWLLWGGVLGAVGGLLVLDYFRVLPPTPFSRSTLVGVLGLVALTGGVVVAGVTRVIE